MTAPGSGPADRADGSAPTAPHGAEATAGPRRRLSLGDPVTGSATEDRPESWGDRTESDSDRLAHYEAQRPPHHGG